MPPSQPVPPPGPLTTSSGMGEVVRAMQRPDSGLEVRERLWLKIKIANAFIGSEVVDWLYKHVAGFSDRREAKKYASQMADNGFIKHGVINKKIFSEQCYYTFREDTPPASNVAPPVGMMANMALGAGENGKGASLPPPTVPAPPVPQEGAAAGWAPPSWQQGVPPSGPNDWNSSPNQSNTTYGPIYNPSAPPPSANYMQMPYDQSGGQYYPHQQPSVISSGGSGSGSQRVLRLAGSGSGSESDGKASTVVSEGNFRSNLGERKQSKMF